MLDVPGPDPVRSDLLQGSADRGIRHAFFTRAGGVSSGIFEGLNVGLGSTDDRAAVEENRRRAAAFLGAAPGALATAHQVHSATAVIATGPFGDDKPRADAVVTATPGLAVGILTADCGPILFADPQARVVAAAHAGWKGALDGVIEATIERMEELGARRESILAALGPSIGPRNYEVGPEFVARFVAADAANGSYFNPSVQQDHAMFDLNAYTLDRLRRAGVSVDHVARCTYAEPENFFSYRRTTHRQEPDYGRQLSAILLET